MNKWRWILLPVVLAVSAIQAAEPEQNRAVCASCHGVLGEGNQALAAPSLAGQDRTYLEQQLQSFKAGRRGYQSDDQPGNRMRVVALKLSDAEITALAGYFSNLKVTKNGIAASTAANAGREQYETTCMACHGQHAQGYAQLRSPNLNILGGWYIAAQLEAYNNGSRGAAVGQDLPAAMMRTIASHIGSLSAPLKP